MTDETVLLHAKVSELEQDNTKLKRRVRLLEGAVGAETLQKVKARVERDAKEHPTRPA